MQRFPESYFKTAFHLHVNYTSCPPSSRLLWEGKVKEDAGKVLKWELCGCSCPLCNLIVPGAISKLSWWAEACEHLLIPFSQLTFASKQDSEGMQNRCSRFPSPVVSTLSQAQHWPKGWGNGSGFPQQPMYTQKRAPGSPTQTACPSPSKPTLLYLTLLPPSPNLSSLPRQPFLTSIFPTSCALQHLLSLPGFLPFPHSSCPFVQPSIRILPPPSRHSITSAQLYSYQLPGHNLGLLCCRGRVSNTHMSPRKWWSS